MDRDLELLIKRRHDGRGEYQVDVVRAPTSGQASGIIHLDVDAILDRLPELESTVLASTTPGRRIAAPQEKPLREVGTQLFETLFSGPINAAYHSSQGVLAEDGQRLRLVLRLAAPELAALPWEMLFDPDDQTYLCRKDVLLRHIPASDYNPKPTRLTPPLRVLGIVSAPRDLPELDTEAEQAHLEQALHPSIAAGLVELVWAADATWSGILSQLRAGPWHILHFIGHGDYDLSSDEGRIALVGENGRSQMVTASALVDLFREAHPSPRLVVLNSCASGASGDTDLFSAVAAAVVHGGISAVVAMQFTVSDRAAIAFSRGFYGALASGRDVDEAALSGRREILGLREQTLEWVTPVLYVRGGSTHLFTLSKPTRPAPPTRAESTPPAAVPATPPPPAAPPAAPFTTVSAAALRAMFVEASAKHRLQDDEGALVLVNDLLALDPSYDGAAELREILQRAQQAAETYARARNAEEAEDWPVAIREYRLLQGLNSYPDAAGRLQHCASRQQVADLHAEMRYLADSGQWRAVLEVHAQLTVLSPTDANPDGLADIAKQKLQPPTPPPAPAPRSPAPTVSDAQRNPAVPLGVPPRVVVEPA
ncbi:hypothetical protein JF66_14875, partial [Cryobacterium sp. MLB-32]|uniref:CHAT domain-containing protein n=1 Tax=Cryobacterium sp. MLB-32 TaxID=1529318 RepID=UPI0004E63BA0